MSTPGPKSPNFAMLVLCLFGIAGALLIGCDQQKIQPTRGSIAAGAVNKLPPIEWRIVSKPELERAYIRGGAQLLSGHELEGFTAIDHETGTVLVYTLPPTSIDGAATLTLGHEIMHVALGDYHKPPQEK